MYVEDRIAFKSDSCQKVACLLITNSLEYQYQLPQTVRGYTSLIQGMQELITYGFSYVTRTNTSWLKFYLVSLYATNYHIYEWE